MRWLVLVAAVTSLSGCAAGAAFMKGFAESAERQERERPPTCDTTCNSYGGQTRCHTTCR